MALNLLQGYDSTDSDEEQPVQKKVKLPAPKLPEYSIPRCLTRDPIKVENNSPHKVRNFAHEAGNWATFAAIPIPIHSEFLEFLEILESTFSSLQLQQVEDFHISLTKVVVLKHHWINDFVASLRQIFENTSTFTVTLHGLSVYVNEEKTRTFLALDVGLGHDLLNEIVNQIDKCMLDYNLPKFYESRSFHLSLLWKLGDVKNEISELITTCHENLAHYSMQVTVQQAFCKTGNKLFKFSVR